MLVNVDIGIEELHQVGREQSSRLFSEIANSSIRGNHLVVCGREVATWVQGQDFLGEHVRSHFRRLGQEYAQTAGILHSNVPQMHVCIGDKITQMESSNVWRTGHLIVLEANLLSPSKLIVEDENSDGSVLRLVLHEHARTYKLPQPRFDLVNGGGSGIFRRFRSSVEGGFVSVCVCDHDQIAPYTAESSTLLNALAEARKHTFVGEVFRLASREIENLFPLSIFIDVFEMHDDPSLKKLENLLKDQGDCVRGDCLWLFFDVKEGINFSKLDRVCKSIDSKSWIIKKLRVATWEDLTDVAFSGFGEAAVMRVMQSDKAKSDFHRFVRGEYWRNHLSDFASSLCWYLASRRPERV